MDLKKATGTGWLCPACGRGVSPALKTCPCRSALVIHNHYHYPPYQPVQTWPVVYPTYQPYTIWCSTGYDTGNTISMNVNAVTSG